MRLKVSDCEADGIHVMNSKNGMRQVFEWSPALTAAIEAAKADTVERARSQLAHKGQRTTDAIYRREPERVKPTR